MIATGYSKLLDVFKSDVSCLTCHGEAWAAWRPGMKRHITVFKWDSEDMFIPVATYYVCGCGRYLQRIPSWVKPWQVKESPPHPGEGRRKL